MIANLIQPLDYYDWEAQLCQYVRLTCNQGEIKQEFWWFEYTG